MTDDPISAGLADNVRLSLVEGVGPRLRTELLSAFGSASAALNASPTLLKKIPGISSKVAERIAAAIETVDAETVIRSAWKNQIDVVTSEQDIYPRLLKEIHDPPGVLYQRGTLIAQDALAITLVGTRQATQYGLRQAERLAASLAGAGLTVVSGLARGIDAAAHRGALRSGGRTIAVLASGLLQIYPPEHRNLASQISQQGCLLTEAPPNQRPFAGAFPQRNRILSGLSVGTVVIEAPIRSGALITARLASEQGREVFALPGPVESRASRGCHALIRDGAALVENIDDILEQLGPLVEPVPRNDTASLREPKELRLNAIEQQVLQAINDEKTSIDVVTRTCGLPVHRVLATISILETKRLVRRVSGQQVTRI